MYLASDPSRTFECTRSWVDASLRSVAQSGRRIRAGSALVATPAPPSDMESTGLRFSTQESLKARVIATMWRGDCPLHYQRRFGGFARVVAVTSLLLGSSSRLRPEFTADGVHVNKQGAHPLVSALVAAVSVTAEPWERT